MANKLRGKFSLARPDYDLSKVRLRGRTVQLVKPLTFMNESGRVLKSLSPLSPESLLIVADDIDLPLGRIRIRSGGSSGDHNGLASVIEHAGTEQFARIRCGVGLTPVGDDAARFVLDEFDDEDIPFSRELAAHAAEATIMVLARSVTAAANVYNRKPPAPLDNNSGGAIGPGESS